MPFWNFVLLVTQDQTEVEEPCSGTAKAANRTVWAWTGKKSANLEMIHTEMLVSSVKFLGKATLIQIPFSSISDLNNFGLEDRETMIEWFGSDDSVQLAVTEALVSAAAFEHKTCDRLPIFKFIPCLHVLGLSNFQIRHTRI